MENKGKIIYRFYPDINIKNIIIFGGIFLFCPIPIILLGYLFKIINDLQYAFHYMIVIDICIIVSSPFIMFIIYYLQSFTIYSNGILSFNPINNKLNFMPWNSMNDIQYNSKIRSGYYIIKSFDNNNQLWLPSYINNRIKFFDLLSAYGDAGHILKFIESKKVEI